MATTLITGASSGIGKHLAGLFAGDGDDLVLVARSEDKLRSIADGLSQQHNINATVIPIDLAQSQSISQLEQELSRRGLVIDHLVNNAGFGALGKFTELAPDRLRDMMMVNMVALTDLTRLLLPGMIDRGSGGVLNVGSVAAYQAGPYMSVYYATKAYVLSFTEGLREELRNTGVHVTLLAPGATETGFGEDSGMGKLKMFSQSAMTVEAVAAAGHAAYRKNKSIVIPGWKNRLIVRLTSLVPRRLKAKAVGDMQRGGA